MLGERDEARVVHDIKHCGDSVAVAHEVHGFVLDTGPVDDLGQFLSRLRHADVAPDLAVP